MSLATAVVALLALAIGSEARPFASLAPAPRQDPALLPYRTVTATVTNPADEPGRAIEITCEAGGPAVIVTAWLPPGEDVRLAAPLPALSVRQTCRVRVLTSVEPEADVLAETDAVLHWEEALLTIDDFVRPRAYGRPAIAAPAWPPAVLRTVTSLAILTAAATAGLCLLKRAGLRVALLVVLTAAGTGGMVKLLTRVPAVETETTSDGLVSLAGRRSTVWRRAGGNLAPLYARKSQMRTDGTILVVGREIRVPVAAGEIRLVTPCPAVAAVQR